MSKRTLIVLIAVGVASIAVIGISVRNGEHTSAVPPAQTGNAAVSSLSRPTKPSVATADKPPLPPEKTDDTASLDEASLMAKLRELQAKDPPLSLKLAREGNARFPNSPEAPERTWFLVRALVDMGRFDDARAESRIMVEKYPKDSWAQDVRRHLLMVPGGPPPPRDESE